MKLPQGYVPGVGVLKHTGGFGGFGQKMLEKMGWQRGQGLGKGKSGMKDAIEVNKKEDTLGVSIGSPAAAAAVTAVSLLGGCICWASPLDILYARMHAHALWHQLAQYS